MKKYMKQKIISNLYYNIVLFSLMSSSIHLLHDNLNTLSHPNLNVSLVKYQENNLDLDLFLSFIKSINRDEELFNNSDNITLDSHFIEGLALEKTMLNNCSGLNLEDSFRYSGMALAHELEDNLKTLAENFNIPYQILLTIGYQESGGNWNNNGVISSTDDYGLFQINQCNLSYIKEQLGYSKEEILNDELKNTEACLLLLSNIIKREDVTTLEDIFGMYNGWVNWQNKSQSVNYVNSCMEIMGAYFPSYEYRKVVTIK